VPDRDAAIDVLRKDLRPGDSVLVKASRGPQLDLIVDALIALAGAEGAPAKEDPQAVPNT
jgi:UDP-N-acetylmuramoyl-tripeptide--D-alanyl-D-alanine ligase